jgi:hypothetical protein
MNPFSTPYEDLADDFRYRGISFDLPGFCDDPSFFAVARGNPKCLNHYAAFVAKRPYDPNYRVRAKIAWVALVDIGRLILWDCNLFWGMPGVLCYAKF